MKKALALILALAMLLSLSVTVLADDDGVITDVNSTEAARAAWASFSNSRITVPGDYTSLSAGSFFIAKFTQAEMEAAKTQGSVFYVKIATDSEKDITGYIGQYASGSTSTRLNIWWPVWINRTTSSYEATINSTHYWTGMNTLTPAMFTADGSYFAVGFSLKTAITSDTTVTITLLDYNGTDSAKGTEGAVIASRSYTFQANANSTATTVSAIEVTGGGSFTEKYEGVFLTDTTYGVPLKVAVTGGNGTETVTWSSNNVSVATVETAASARERGIVLTESEAAYVTFKGVGTAIITASIGDVKGTYEVILSKEPSVAVAEEQNYDSLAEAVGGVADGTEIAVGKSTNIGSTVVEAGSTVTATTDTSTAAATNEGTTVTPKTLTISKDGEETKTVKAYVVSSGSDENEVKAVVTNVAKDNTFTNETSSSSVENYVNVAQVLANAVAEKSIDVSSISSMELSLKKTDNATLPTEVSKKVAESEKTVTFEVHPVATVKTTTNGTTTETTYDVSNEELADNASFTFKLTGLTPDQHYTLYHYASDGTLKNTFYQTADGNGEVTLTLSSFSYIVGEESEEATDFATLVARAQPGQTIVLTEDVELTDSIDIDKELTIDLNGHSITPVAGSVDSGKFTANTDHDYLIGVKRGGNLTIQDSSTSKTGAINSGDLWVAVKATLKGEAATGDAATITVNGGSITGYYYAISGNGTRHGTVITVNDGTLTGTNGTAIYHPQDGTLTISGGSLTGEDTAVELRSGTLKVTDGTFTAMADEYSCSPNGSGTTTSGAALAIAQHTTNKPIDANITGGTYSGVKTISIANPQNNAFDNVAVSGSASLLTGSIEIPEGYEWVTEGGVSTLEKSFVSEAYDGNVAQANFVDTTFINVQDSLYLNVVLYVGGTEKTNGSVKFSFLGINKTVALSDFDVVTSATLDQRSAIALATNGYYCYRDGNYYIVRLKVLAYQISAEAAVQLLDGDGKAVKLYQNTGASCFLNETAPLANKLLTINANNQYTGSVKTFLTNYSGSEAAVVAALLAYGTEAEKVWEYDGTKKS